MILFRKINEFSSWILKGIKLKYKAIIIVVCAILGGHLCDTEFGFSFPFFKIAFTFVAFIVVSFINGIEDGEEQ